MPTERSQTALYDQEENRDTDGPHTKSHLFLQNEQVFPCSILGCNENKLLFDASPDLDDTTTGRADRLDGFEFVDGGGETNEEQEDEVARMVLRLGGNGF